MLGVAIPRGIVGIGWVGGVDICELGVAGWSEREKEEEEYATDHNQSEGKDQSGVKVKGIAVR